MKASFTEDLFDRRVSVEAVRASGQSSRGVRCIRLRVVDKTSTHDIVLTADDWERISALMTCCERFAPEVDADVYPEPM